MSNPKSEPSVSFLDDEPLPPEQSSWVAPPPGGGQSSPPPPTAFGAASAKTGAAKSKRGHRFEAEIDVAELDDRGRPVSTWTARGRELDRSRLAFMSRRMCYPGRQVIVAVHLIDSAPVPLFGKVHACEYEGEGLCRVELDLIEVPDEKPLRDWLDAISRRRGNRA